MKTYNLALIFTGHMVDLPARESPRFPSYLEQDAVKAIRLRVGQAKGQARGSVVGIASGARGGDILFLEACRKEGLPIRMVLPFEPEKFLDTSVRGTDGGWERRFHALWDSLPQTQREVLTAPEGENGYDYCNRRMLQLAKELARKVRLLALWDGKDTEPKPGGTASFVDLVKRSGGQFSHIDSELLLRNRQ
jgi:hypothetical protein